MILKKLHYMSVHVYLTIIPRTCIEYELLDSRRGTEHRVSYHKLISHKHEWNNYFIKYQTLNKNISSFISTDSGFWAFYGQTFHDKSVSFHIWQTAVYRIYTMSREPIRLITRNSISSVWYLIKIDIHV